jgi:hypothetical protein
VESATQIDLDILPPDLRVAFPDRTEGPEGAVIVDDQVNLPELGSDAAERILDSEAIDKIHREGDCHPAGAGDEGCGLIYLARRSRQDGDLGASVRLVKRDLAPDSAPSAGNDCDGAIQVGHEQTLPFHDARGKTQVD